MFRQTHSAAGLTTAVNPPFLHSFFTGDKNQQIHAEIVSVHKGVVLTAKDEAALPEDVRKAFAAFIEEFMFVLVKLADGQYAQDTIVSLKGQTPKKGDEWVFTTPEPKSIHPFGERLAQ